MSTVAVFTPQDLKRQPAKVLEVARKFGGVEIRTRSGEVFTLTPKIETRPNGRRRKFPDFAARWRRMKELGHVPPPASEDERINRIIAGEE